MIVSCGEALIDFLPAGFGRDIGYVPRPGGSPFNLALNLAHHGLNSAFLGAISQDALGEFLITAMANHGVSDRYVVRRPQPSALSFASLVAFGSGEKAFFNENTASSQLEPADMPADFGTDVKGLCFGSLALVTEPAGKTLLGLMQREAGKRFIALDPNVRLNILPDQAAYRRRIEKAARCADLVKCSRRDLASIYPGQPYETAARGLLKFGVKTVIVTLGAEGAMLLRADGLTLTDALPARNSVSIGTGSSFHAAFLAFLIKHDALNAVGLLHIGEDKLREGLRYANHVASMTHRNMRDAAPLAQVS